MKRWSRSTQSDSAVIEGYVYFAGTDFAADPTGRM